MVTCSLHFDELWVYEIVSICCIEKLLRYTNMERGKFISPKSRPRTTSREESSLGHTNLFLDTKWSSLKAYTHKQYLSMTYQVAVTYLEK